MSAFVALQRLLPQHALSRLVGSLAASEQRLIAAPFIRLFARAYDITLDEAERSAFSDYRSFNDFFTRSLKDGARPMAEAPSAVLSPADGVISQMGTIRDGELLQSKGKRFRFDTLTAGIAQKPFEGGSFMTIYLAPSDYHRVHIPAAAQLLASTCVPGELYSVNSRTEAEIEGLFARNERLVCEFETEHGRMLSIMVGAMIVASIETVWGGPSSPYRALSRQQHEGVKLQRGAEMGRFLLGSTVILCFEPGQVSWRDDLAPGSVVRVNEAVGQFNQEAEAHPG